MTAFLAGWFNIRKQYRWYLNVPLWVRLLVRFGFSWNQLKRNLKVPRRTKKRIRISRASKYRLAKLEKLISAYWRWRCREIRSFEVMGMLCSTTPWYDNVQNHFAFVLANRGTSSPTWVTLEDNRIRTLCSFRCISCQDEHDNWAFLYY